MRRTENGAGEAHAEIDAHAMVTHDAVQVGFVGRELKIGQEAEGAEGEGEYGRDDALEKPRGKEDSAVAAEGEDEVEGFGRGPAEVGGPVFQHTLIARVGREEGGDVESLGGAEFSINEDGHAKVGAVAGSLK